MFINNFVDLYFIKGFVLFTIENFSRIFLFYFLIGLLTFTFIEWHVRFNSLHLNSLYVRFNSLHLNSLYVRFNSLHLKSLYDHLFLFFKFESLCLCCFKYTPFQTFSDQGWIIRINNCSIYIEKRWYFHTIDLTKV